MNTSESLDLLSDVLLEDERIVSSDEREFLADLLHHSETNPHTSSPAITQAIAKIAGEIVVKRAGSLMAETILRKLTEQNLPHISSMPPRPPAPQPPNPGPTPGGYRGQRTRTAGGGGAPRPPHPSPPPPGPTPGAYRTAEQRTSTLSLPPRPPAPQPPNPGPGPGMQRAIGPKGILDLAIAEKHDLVPPRCLLLDEFLAPAELHDLLSYTLEEEKHFNLSEVISPEVYNGSSVDFEHRRSHVLMDLDMHYDRFIDRLQSTLPRLLPKLGIEPFPVVGVEAQITASKDGDFFRWHNDNGQDEVSGRKITFVYFFHREPKVFTGGELRIQGPVIDNSGFGDGNYYTIVPRQNQLALFDSSLMHEITPVRCSSGKFADSRFTVNGWIRR